MTVVDEVADALARRIVAGTYPPGTLAPSVRQVAEEFSVNRATAQLVLGRLESAGFVAVRRGLGFTVRDVRREGGLEAHRRLFRYARELPGTAVELFAGILRLYRSLVGPDAPVPPPGLDGHLGLARELLPELSVELAVANSLGEILREVPEARTALAEPAGGGSLEDQHRRIVERFAGLVGA